MCQEGEELPSVQDKGNAFTTLTWDESIFAMGELFVINVCYVVLIIL